VPYCEPKHEPSCDMKEHCVRVGASAVVCVPQLSRQSAQLVRDLASCDGAPEKDRLADELPLRLTDRGRGAAHEVVDVVGEIDGGLAHGTRSLRRGDDRSGVVGYLR
jgi:hypothetical protein